MDTNQWWSSYIILTVEDLTYLTWKLFKLTITKSISQSLWEDGFQDHQARWHTRVKVEMPLLQCSRLRPTMWPMFRQHKSINISLIYCSNVTSWAEFEAVSLIWKNFLKQQNCDNMDGNQTNVIYNIFSIRFHATELLIF